MSGAENNSAGSADKREKKVVGKPFVKGDPRINRNGRPPNFDAARKLAKLVANEIATDENGEPLIINGKKITVINALLLDLATSGNAQKQRAFLEYAYGKVPQAVEMTGADGGPVVLTWPDEVKD